MKLGIGNKWNIQKRGDPWLQDSIHQNIVRNEQCTTVEICQLIGTELPNSKHFKNWSAHVSMYSLQMFEVSNRDFQHYSKILHEMAAISNVLLANQHKDKCDSLGVNI